jgi:hypothetical protein
MIQVRCHSLDEGRIVPMAKKPAKKAAKKPAKKK